MERKKTVLIVDDDKFLLDTYSLKFREDGFTVEIGVGGEDALNKLRSGLEPDIILLDMIMSGIDGFVFLETLKKEALGKNSHVIMLSNQGQEDEITKAKELGAHSCIVKASAIPSEVLEQAKESLN